MRKSGMTRSQLPLARVRTPRLSTRVRAGVAHAARAVVRVPSGLVRVVHCLERHRAIASSLLVALVLPAGLLYLLGSVSPTTGFILLLAYSFLVMGVLLFGVDHESYVEQSKRD